jgi:hypothetical protein
MRKRLFWTGVPLIASLIFPLTQPIETLLNSDGEMFSAPAPVETSTVGLQPAAVAECAEPLATDTFARSAVMENNCNSLPVKITKVEHKGRRAASEVVEISWEATAPSCLKMSEFKIDVEMIREGHVRRKGTAMVDGFKRSAFVYVTFYPSDGPISSYRVFITATATRTITGGASAFGAFRDAQ